ncbi:MAG: lipopolysaccharide biosynthesis protein [Thermodesulfobacteriota bacterium]
MFSEKIKNLIVRLQGRFRSKGSFVTHVITLMTGTALAHGVTVIGIPFLSRSYSPEHFGIFSIFVGIGSTLSVWAALRYELAIVLPEKQEDAMALVKLSSAVVFGVAVLILIIVLLLGSRIVSSFNLPYFDPWLKYLPLSILLGGLYNVLYYWCTRNSRFDKISVSRALQSFSTVCSQLAAFALFMAGVGGLIGGYIIGQIGGVGMLLTQLKGVRFRDPTCSILRTKVATIYSDFPKFSGSGAFFDMAAVQIPLVMIPLLFSPHTGGLYAFADRLLRAPSGLVGMSVSQVLFQRLAASKEDPDGRRSLIFSIWKYMFLLGIGPMLMVFLFGPRIFSFFLGFHWQEAGRYAQILCIGFMAHFIAYPTSLGIVALGRLDILFAWQVLNLASTVAVFGLGYFFLRENFYAFLWIWTFKELFVYLLYMFALLKAHSLERIENR